MRVNRQECFGCPKLNSYIFIDRQYILFEGQSTSTESPQRDSVSSEPALLLRGSLLVGLVATGEETSVLLASGSEASSISALVLVGGNPVDSGVAGDSLVVGVNEDDFEELEGSVLTDPVGVENSEVSATSGNSLLSGGTVRAVGLQLVDTLVDGLAVDDTLGDGSLAATSSNSDSVDHVSLLGLVAELSGLVDAGRSVNLVNDGELSVLPRSHSEDEAEHVALLLSP